jgi:hypothetical protein
LSETTPEAPTTTAAATDPVILPPPPSYQQGVNAIVDQLNDDTNAPLWSTQMNDLATSVHSMYDALLTIAYGLTGTDATSRAQARDAVRNVLYPRLGSEVYVAMAAAEQADQPAPEEPPAGV